MIGYELVHIVTNAIFVFAIYKLFHSFFFEEIYNKKIEWVSYILYYFFSSGIILITKLPLLLLVFTISFMFMLSLNYKSSIQKKIIVSFFIYTILFVIEIVISVGLGFIDFSAIKNSTFDSVIGLILIRTTTMIVAYLLNKYKSAANKDYQLPKIYYLTFSIILIGTLYLFANSLENASLTLHNVIVSGAILIIVNITMIIIDEKIYKSIIISNEKNILQQQNVFYENQAEIINQSTESIRALKHDMKNHFLMLNEMFKNDKKIEIEKYIKNILNDIDGGMFSQSNNFVVDSIINFKLAKLQDINVELNIDINVPQVIHITPYDMTVLLGNLLDNSISALLKCKKRELNLRISCSMGNLIILISNTYEGNVIFKNEKFLTTKSSKENHGIGLGNVNKVIEKYDGEIRIEYTDNMFLVDVLIPQNNCILI